MITPGLWRRSLRGGAQWRLLLVWVAALAVPSLAALLPLASLLRGALDRAPRAQALAAALDAEAFIDLVHVLASDEAVTAFRPAVGISAVLALLVSPLLAGAAVAAARSAERLGFRDLLRGAGEWYGRMLRMLLVAALPLGAAAGIGALAFGGADRRALKALTESSADAGLRAALALTLAAAFVAHVTLDLARGTMAAQPDRRSALLAWGHAVRVLFRRPLQALGLGLLTTLSALLLAALLLLLRLQISQGSAASVLLALLLAQLAVAAIGWGRASRVIGFAELVRADEAERARLALPPAAAASATVPATASQPPDLPPELESGTD